MPNMIHFFLGAKSQCFQPCLDFLPGRKLLQNTSRFPSEGNPTGFLLPLSSQDPDIRFAIFASLDNRYDQRLDAEFLLPQTDPFSLFPDCWFCLIEERFFNLLTRWTFGEVSYFCLRFAVCMYIIFHSVVGFEIFQDKLSFRFENHGNGKKTIGLFRNFQCPHFVFFVYFQSTEN